MGWNAHEILYNLHPFEIKVEYDYEHIMGLDLIVN
jgi:hypothetical protein